MSELHHDDVRYEPTDVAPGGIVKFLFVLIVAMAGFMVLLWFAQARLLTREHDAKKPTNLVAANSHEQLPPAPRFCW